MKIHEKPWIQPVVVLSHFGIFWVTCPFVHVDPYFKKKIKWCIPTIFLWIELRKKARQPGRPAPLSD